MWVYFLSGLAMAEMESMLFPFVADRFCWGLEKSSMGFAYIGILMVITQGYLVRRWMPRFGEARVLLSGLFFFALSLFLIPVSISIWLLAGTMTILAIGNGLMRPPNLGLISLSTPAEEQGAVMGVTNSLASLGRIMGPAIGGLFYERLSPNAPFYFGGLLALLAFFLAFWQLKRRAATPSRSIGQ